MKTTKPLKSINDLDHFDNIETDEVVLKHEKNDKLIDEWLVTTKKSKNKGKVISALLKGDDLELLKEISELTGKSIKEIIVFGLKLIEAELKKKGIK